MLQNSLSVVNMAHIHGYLTIIPRARVGYEMIGSFSINDGNGNDNDNAIN